MLPLQDASRYERIAERQEQMAQTLAELGDALRQETERVAILRARLFGLVDESTQSASAEVSSDLASQTMPFIARTGDVVLSHDMETLPTGWLECDGTEKSVGVYLRLYRRIGDNYGAATDATRFVLPGTSDLPSCDAVTNGYARYLIRM